MKRKGFTLVELLVVIAVIALLMGILMPALAKVRQIAQRIMCGTNLSGIAKAMQVYANDYEDDLPRGGRRIAYWSDDGTLGGLSNLRKWASRERSIVYGTPQDLVEDLTITTSLYLLVKYADVTVNQFVCNGDSGTKPLELSEYDFPPQVDYQPDFPDLWDFGHIPGLSCSYSYHMPYKAKGDNAAEEGKQFVISTASNSKSPVCADRSPYLDMNAESYVDGVETDEEAPEFDDAGEGYQDPDKTGNAYPHQREGQNVMYADSHVEFAKFPNCGINNDHIYKFWPNDGPTVQQREVDMLSQGETEGGRGVSGIGFGAPVDYKDAYLVNEYQLHPEN